MHKPVGNVRDAPLTPPPSRAGSVTGGETRETFPSPEGLGSSRGAGAGLQRLPRSRRLVTDLLYFAKKIPSQPLAMHCRIPVLVRLQKEATFPGGSLGTRSRLGPSSRLGPNAPLAASSRCGSRCRISWPALFMKAYGVLSARHPLLRQCFMSWPWPYVYEHPFPIARMTVARHHAGEKWVFFARVERPEQYALAGLQEQINEFKHAPIASVERFHLQDLFSHVPMLLRRPAWWLTLHVSGRARVDRLGTFGMTTVSGRGGVSIHPPLITTTTLTFGPVDPAGNVRITIVYDHRLMDGGTVAEFLEDLESILNGEIVEEMRSLAGVPQEESERVRDVPAPQWAAEMHPQLGLEPSRVRDRVVSGTSRSLTGFGPSKRSTD